RLRFAGALEAVGCVRDPARRDLAPHEPRACGRQDVASELARRSAARVAMKVRKHVVLLALPLLLAGVAARGSASSLRLPQAPRCPWFPGGSPLRTRGCKCAV